MSNYEQIKTIYETSVFKNITHLIDGVYVPLSTKWKNIGANNPSPDDLRQLYSYSHYYDAKQTALVYPGKSDVKKGHYLDINGNDISDRNCSVITLNVNNKVVEWQKEIACTIFGDWMELHHYKEKNCQNTRK
jgi:5-methylcytosine-specific restriction enzyme subunit McrC